MTQLTFEVETTVEDAIREAAEKLGINALTLFDEGTVTQPHFYWSSWRTFKWAGASGPCLDDFEAAVLIAAGVEFSVHEYAA